MRLRSLILLGLGLLLLAVGLLWWRQADRSVAGNNQAAPAGGAVATPVRAGRSASTNQGSISESTTSVLPGGKKSPAKTDPLVYRLSNTTKSSQQLLRDDNALLLENALIDSRQPLGFQIPERLRVVGDPGSYIVQSRGPLDAAFRRALADAGAEYVSYIPNNAWLVRATKEVAARLAASPETQAVLPWEPIYKLKTELLVLAMENKPLPPDAKLNLLIYNGAQTEVFEQLDQLQLVRLAEDRSPFGTVVTVQPGLDWMTLAQLPGVQLMERAYPRARANDLTRVRIGVAQDSRTATNYLGLTGTNVLLNINDWGVDAAHPDFANRLFAVNPLALGDTNGHGTHGVGIMAGSGFASTNVMNARGSINPATNFQYRGIAPAAKIFTQLATDADGDLQENVARTNAFISNNSWGYLGDSTYSLAAASYDAAVRDSLPGVSGSQPVLYVFSAGNEGGGTDAGLGGSPGSLSSPATAKNVVSVGAGELLRDITNQVQKVTSGVTNTTTPWQAMTSSDNQVAAFSSRGNVGIRIEGDFGRFKPDVIAPGTFIVSTRSTTWDERAYYNPTNHNRSLLQNQIVGENGFNTYPIFIPENTVGFTIVLIPNDDSPPTLDLPLYLRRDGAPTLATFDLLTTNFVAVPPALGGVGTSVGQNWFFAVTNPTEDDVTFDILTDIIVTNDLGNYYTVLSNLNNSLSGTNLPVATNFYRYESGTSMAAPAVSGTLGLMQEFFEKQQRTNSPALMKALLINGARTIANIYDFQVRNTINYQGWGMINLANSLPNTVSNAFDLTANSAGAIKLIDQSPTNALATGQSHTRYIALSELGQTAPLRITLVWTDPAANPAAGVKLVNDLDLVVTNMDTGDIYFGNDFPNVDPYNNFWDTNEPPVVDSVNNVENVYLSPFLGTNYSITVSARRVNVNAVTAHTNDVVQDYALVISSGSGEFTNAFAISNQVFNAVPQLSQVTFVTNTINQSDFAASFLENQRVGANPALLPLLNSTNGMTNQWKFFVVTNTTDFTNAAFLISLQTDLATPRAGVFAEDEEATRRYADLDLYVTVNTPDLTNLSPAVVAGSFQSRSRNDLSGDEFVIFTNAALNNIYYVGVKSEDQMAAQFDFFAIFSLNPLGAEDGNGFVRAYPLTGYAIPEGPPSNPGGTRFVAITTPSTSGEAQSVRQVIITNYLSHDHFGDLINAVDHNSRVVIMDNHRSLTTPPYPVPPGPYAFLYDDSGEGTFPNSIPTDGPGSLNSFQGESPGGTWYFTYSDDALSQVGSVSNVMIRVDRQCETDCTLTNTVAGNSWSYFSRNIPVEATNFTVCINIISGSPQPLQLYIRKDRRPTDTLYDYTMTINPSGCLSVDKFDLPPLSAGRYFISVFNGNPTAQTFTYQSIVELGEPPTPAQFGSVGSAPLLDDAITNHTVFVTETNPISRLDVGLRIDHPRVSDLAVTLVSPNGTRVLLVENRGGTNEGGFGTSLTVTNFVPVDATGGPAGVTNFIDTGATVGTVNIDYQFFQQPDQMTVYYQGLQLTNTGLISGAGRLTLAYGPGASTIVEVRMNELGNPSTNTAWNYTVSSINNSHSYLIFTDNTNRTTTPIKFAPPPFNAGGTGNTSIWHSSFETTSGQTYFTGQYIPDGWRVVSGNVDIIGPPAYGPAAEGSYMLDINGGTAGQVGTNIVTVPGRRYLLSYAYERNPDSRTFCFVTPSAQVLIDSNVVSTVVADDPTNTWLTLTWETNSYLFTATSTNTRIDLRGHPTNTTACGVLFDALDVAEITDRSRYVLPEESLKVFEGEIPYGLWKLEILDNRTGASNNVALVDWQLQIVAQDNKPLPGILLPGEPQTNSVPPGGIVYYIVDVPPWAQYATNQLLFASGPVNVLFNQSTPPVGIVVPDYLLIGPNVIVGTTTLDAGTTPPLLPGLRYYLGVQNPGTSNVTFALQVDYNITALTNGISVASTLAASSVPRYFFYDISTNATATSFRLFGLSGNVDLVARRGGPLPTLIGNDYGSFNPGANNEDIVLLPASTPVPLTPGRWYLGVFNRDVVPVNYNIVATEFTNTLPNIITLTNAISYGNTNSGAGAGVDYYRFVVSPDSVRAQFEINTPSDDVTLVARKGLPLPDLGLYDYISANVYTNDELIVLTTNSAPVILSPGDWFLTAVNLTGLPVSYSIKATEWSAAEVAPFIITSYTITSNEFCITWNSVPGAYYFVQGKTNLNAPNWDRVSPQITAVDYSTTWCIPLPSPYQFFRVGEGLVLSTFVPPPRIQSLTVGTNGVTLRWNGPITASYNVQWSPSLAPPVWGTFTNVITSPTGLFQFIDDGTQTSGLGVTRYYRLILLP